MLFEVAKMTNVTFFAILAIIFCDFETDYCHFELDPKDATIDTYAWTRKNAKNLEEDTYPGPPEDQQHSKEGNFIIASNMLSADAPKTSQALIKSPYLVGKDHPEACLSFVVYFGVI